MQFFPKETKRGNISGNNILVNDNRRGASLRKENSEKIKILG
jgi:hypothetical protein